MKKSIGKFRRMIEARESLEMTQAEFAEYIGISSNYVYLIESGKKPPGPKIIEKLDQIESKKLSNFLVKEEPSVLYGSAFDVWSAVPTDQLEALLTTCAKERDWMAVEKVASELANRKMKERMNP